MTKIQQVVQFTVKKIWSTPGVAIAAFVGLLVGMCIYFGPLETYTPITNWYHSVFSNDYWRHLVVRASPETLFAAWFAQCVAVISVVNNRLKAYRVFKTHELFWRPFVGVLVALPGSAVTAVVIWHWHLSQYLTTTVSNRPGVSAQLAQSVALDGDKKIIVLVGSLTAVWYMRAYFLNIQGWLAENRIISVRAKNAARDEIGFYKKVPYTRFYHHLFPGFCDRIRFIVKNEDVHVSDTKGNMRFVSLNEHNHRPVNRAIYKAFNAIVLAGIAGGLYIMFFIAQGTYLAIHVVH